MISPTAYLLKMTHFLIHLSIDNMIIFPQNLLMLLSHDICITRQSHCHIFIIIKWKYFLWLIIIMLFLHQSSIFIIIHTSINHMICIPHHHMILVIIFLRKPLSVLMIILFTYIIISLSKSVRPCIMHLIQTGCSKPTLIMHLISVTLWDPSCCHHISWCSIGSLRSMCRMSQTFSFFNFLVYMS